MSCCSICLNQVRSTRQNTKLPCNHLYHKKCLDDWVKQGKNTCPTCRTRFGPPKYKLSISIENLETETSDTLSNLSDDITMTIFEGLGVNPTNIISTDVTFEPEELGSIRELLADMGVSLADFDPSIFNTEGSTVS